MTWPKRGARATSERGYGASWQALRLSVLAAEPICRACGSQATDVDHCIPKVLGGSDARLNLEPLCSPCHRTKTARERMGIIVSIGPAPRLFVDVDGTLVPFGKRDADPKVAMFVRGWARANPTGSVIIWSKRGEEYARASGAAHLGDVAHGSASKRGLRPKPGWLFIDDEPLASWAAVCIRPWRLPRREGRLRAVEAHPGAVL